MASQSQEYEDGKYILINVNIEKNKINDNKKLDLYLK